MAEKPPDFDESLKEQVRKAAGIDRAELEDIIIAGRMLGISQLLTQPVDELIELLKKEKLLSDDELLAIRNGEDLSDYPNALMLARLMNARTLANKLALEDLPAHLERKRIEKRTINAFIMFLTALFAALVSFTVYECNESSKDKNKLEQKLKRAKEKVKNCLEGKKKT